MSATSRPLTALPVRAGERLSGVEPASGSAAPVCAADGGRPGPPLSSALPLGPPCVRASLGTVPLTFRSRDARTTSCGKCVQRAQRGAPRCRQPGDPRRGRSGGTQRPDLPLGVFRTLCSGAADRQLLAAYTGDSAPSRGPQRYELSERIRGNTVSKTLSCSVVSSPSLQPSPTPGHTSPPKAPNTDFHKITHSPPSNF